MGFDVAIDILPAQEGTLGLRHAYTDRPRRWIRAERHNVELGLLIENPLLTQQVELQIRQLEPALYEVVSRPH